MLRAFGGSAGASGSVARGPDREAAPSQPLDAEYGTEVREVLAGVACLNPEKSPTQTLDAREALLFHSIGVICGDTLIQNASRNDDLPIPDATPEH